MSYQLSIAVALSISVLGCANSAQMLRSRPVTHYPSSNTQLSTPGGLSGLLSLRCVKGDEESSSETTSEYHECTYVSADISGLVDQMGDPQVEAKRNTLVSLLTSISDMNCSTFLHRAFANRAGADFTKSFVTDIATGASAVTAFSSAAASSVLSVSNLVVGKGIDSFNSTYYFEKSFQAMESAITAERALIKTEMIAKQADVTGSYTIAHALSDIRRYDDACSIRAGLSKLVEISDDSNRRAQEKKTDVELSNDPKVTYQEQRAKRIEE